MPWMILAFLLTLSQVVAPASVLAQSAPRCAFEASYPIGTVLELEGTPHLWISASGGAPRWAGDTRALAGVAVRWDSRCIMDLAFLLRMRKGDPYLSAGLVKLGEPIYLAKWETNESEPMLLHVQSITDMELFGINAGNYTGFVLERDEWQRRFGFNTDTLRRGQLAQVAPPGTRASPPPAPLPPRPTPVPAPPAPRYPLVDPPTDDVGFWCLQANPSCSTDPWWVEWNELQSSELVEYRFAPGLVSERRLIEAIWLLWQWPEGKDLLRDGGASGVIIVTVSADVLPESFASYNSVFKRIRVSRRFAETSTWMLADVLAHELKHASDDRGGLYQTLTFADCLTTEQRAYEVEARYLRWIQSRFGTLPTASQIATRLSLEDSELFLNLRGIATSPNPTSLATQDYRGSCSRFS